jgi:hypothetical protein
MQPGYGTAEKRVLREEVQGARRTVTETYLKPGEVASTGERSNSLEKSVFQRFPILM